MRTTYDHFPDEPEVVPFKSMAQLVRDSKEEECSRCGNRAPSLYPHSINSSMVRVMEDLARFMLDGDYWCHIGEGHRVTGTKSRKLVMSANNARLQVRRSGWYRLTKQFPERRSNKWRIQKNGVLFLRGELDVPKKLLEYHGKITHISEERVFVDDVRGVIRDKAFWDNHPFTDEIFMEPVQ